MTYECAQCKGLGPTPNEILHLPGCPEDKHSYTVADGGVRCDDCGAVGLFRATIKHYENCTPKPTQS